MKIRENLFIGHFQCGTLDSWVRLLRENKITSILSVKIHGHDNFELSSSRAIFDTQFPQERQFQVHPFWSRPDKDVLWDIQQACQWVDGQLASEGINLCEYPDVKEDGYNLQRGAEWTVVKPRVLISTCGEGPMLALPMLIAFLMRDTRDSFGSIMKDVEHKMGFDPRTAPIGTALLEPVYTRYLSAWQQSKYAVAPPSPPARPSSPPEETPGLEKRRKISHQQSLGLEPPSPGDYRIPTDGWAAWDVREAQRLSREAFFRNVFGPEEGMGQQTGEMFTQGETEYAISSPQGTVRDFTIPQSLSEMYEERQLSGTQMGLPSIKPWFSTPFSNQRMPTPTTVLGDASPGATKKGSSVSRVPTNR